MTVKTELSNLKEDLYLMKQQLAKLKEKKKVKRINELNNEETLHDSSSSTDKEEIAVREGIIAKITEEIKDESDSETIPKSCHY